MTQRAYTKGLVLRLLVLIYILLIFLTACEDTSSDSTDQEGAWGQAEMEVQAGMEIQAGTEQTPFAPNQEVTSCEEFGSILCFANNDCRADARCQNVGDELSPLPCCVQGERGTATVGEYCDTGDGQLTCASSLCIGEEQATNGYCSGECLSNADCPETMPRCISVAFSGSDLMWCFPPESGE